MNKKRIAAIAGIAVAVCVVVGAGIFFWVRQKGASGKAEVYVSTVKSLTEAASGSENRYAGVVLDRSFRLSAEPVGDPVFRDAALLSAGALDQLYLAVRLAICELVLPPEKQVPIVLDDALANFDDSRCAAALQFLKEAAGNRQILLFTCHSREGEFFAGDREVFVQRLTDAAVEV